MLEKILTLDPINVLILIKFDAYWNRTKKLNNLPDFDILWRLKLEKDIGDNSNPLNASPQEQMT